MKKVRQALLVMFAALLVIGSIAGCGKKEEAKDYLEWTAKDWEKASDKDKKACAVEYTKYTAEAAGMEDQKDQADNMSDEEVDTIVSALDILFQASGDKTLKATVDDTMGAVQNMEDGQETEE